ncbi:MAG: nicotinamide-nucleotide amidohydrolase family protein [Thiolinea sp.]
MEKDVLMVLVHAVAELLLERGLRLATAESCTGGWVAKVCTDLPGSSEWFECGFVTYSNVAKQDMLEVSDITLETFGAVSEVVTAEMARGVIANSQASVSVSVSGIAGPGGATPDKPVGMVCFGWLVPDRPVKTATCYFDGDREAVRQQAVEHALRGLLALLR